MKRRGITWLAIASAIALVVGAAAIYRIAAESSRVTRTRADAILLKKGDADSLKVGRTAETTPTAIGPHDQRDPNSTPDIQAYLQRAFPAADIPVEATLAAQSGWASLNAAAHSPGPGSSLAPARRSIRVY
jgi:hypothetical protein